jgi:hypothetical protein
MEIAGALPVGGISDVGSMKYGGRMKGHIDCWIVSVHLRSQ